jgi:hypothetical protein
MHTVRLKHREHKHKVYKGARTWELSWQPVGSWYQILDAIVPLSKALNPPQQVPGHSVWQPPHTSPKILEVYI